MFWKYLWGGFGRGVINSLLDQKQPGGPPVDIGILTVISFNLLINAAVVVAFEDTMIEFARMYNPSLPTEAFG